MNNHEDVVKHRARVIVIQRVLVVMVCIGLVLVLALLSYDAYNGLKVRSEIVNCTTPEGKCFAENQRRTAEAVRAIAEDGIEREAVTRRIISLAASCADEPGPQTYKEIEACIRDRLKEE
jgi:hypothetical protein